MNFFLYLTLAMSQCNYYNLAQAYKQLTMNIHAGIAYSSNTLPNLNSFFVKEESFSILIYARPL